MTDEEREWVEQWGTDLEKRMLLELDAARAKIVRALQLQRWDLEHWGDDHYMQASDDGDFLRWDDLLKAVKP